MHTLKPIHSHDIQTISSSISKHTTWIMLRWAKWLSARAKYTNQLKINSDNFFLSQWDFRMKMNFFGWKEAFAFDWVSIQMIRENSKLYLTLDFQWLHIIQVLCNNSFSCINPHAHTHLHTPRLYFSSIDFKTPIKNTSRTLSDVILWCIFNLFSYKDIVLRHSTYYMK